MDEGRIIENPNHELISVFHVLLEYILRTSHAFVEGFSIEQMCLKITHVTPDMMRKFSQISDF